MNRYILIFVVFFMTCHSQFCIGQTRPDWLDIKNTPIVDVSTFGARGDDTADDTAAMQAAINYAATHKSVVIVPAGTYFCNITLPNTVDMRGVNQYSVILKPYTSDPVISIGYKTTWYYNNIQDMTLRGTSLQGVGIKYATSASGRTNFENLYFSGFSVGLSAERGNIGLTLQRCSLVGNSCGAKFISDTTSHPGCVTITQCYFGLNASAAVVIDNQPNRQSVGTFRIVDSVFEANAGHDILVSNFYRTRGGLILDNNWFEHTTQYPKNTAPITVGSYTYLPSNITAYNSTAVISNSLLETINADKSELRMNYCSIPQLSYGKPSWVLASGSVLEWSNFRVSQRNEKLGMIRSLTNAVSYSAIASVPTAIAVLQLPLKTNFVPRGDYYTVCAATLASETANYTIDSVLTLATHTTDGICSGDPDAIQFIASTTSVTYLQNYDMHDGLVATLPYVAWSVNVKKNNAEGVNITPLRLAWHSGTTGMPFVGMGRTIIDKTYKTGLWFTIGGVFRTNAVSDSGLFYLSQLAAAGTTIAGDYTIQGFQMVAFDCERDALEFINTNIIVGKGSR